MELLDRVPQYVYVTVKYQISKIVLFKTQPKTIQLLSLLLSIVLIPVLMTTLLLSLSYRKLVDIILRNNLKDKYREQLRGVDAICCNQACCTPSFFLLLEYHKTHKELYEDFIRFVNRCKFPRHEKLFYSWSTFLGYHYYFKNSLESKDFVTLAEDDGTIIRTKKDFGKVIMQYDVKPMPDEDRAMFHIIIYPNTVSLPNAEGTTLICMKMHHALADGRSMLSWIMADLADDQPISNGNGHTTNGNGIGHTHNGTNKSSDSDSESFLDRVMRILQEDKIKVLPSDFQDDNILVGGKTLADEKHICWFSDTSSEYLDKIRTIRKSRVGVTFLDVINTCVSASLQEYFEKHSPAGVPIPSTVSGGVVLSPAKYTFRYGDTDFTFSNEFSVGGFTFPIAHIDGTLGKDKGTQLLAKLNFCQKEYQAIKDGIDVKYYYWLSDILSLLPYQIPKYFSHNFMHITMGVSSLPGSDHTIEIFGGNPIKNIILMPPNSPGTGLHFVNCSYGRKFLMALTCDNSVIPEFDHAQCIVDAVIRNLDLLHDTVLKTCNGNHYEKA